MKCCQLVYNELLGVVAEACSRVAALQSFPNCITAIQNVMSQVVSKQLKNRCIEHGACLILVLRPYQVVFYRHGAALRSAG